MTCEVACVTTDVGDAATLGGEQLASRTATELERLVPPAAGA